MSLAQLLLVKMQKKNAKEILTNKISSIVAPSLIVSETNQICFHGFSDLLFHLSILEKGFSKKHFLAGKQSFPKIGKPMGYRPKSLVYSESAW
jgi:hypothetical protein